jgi:hypothetical protein
MVKRQNISIRRIAVDEVAAEEAEAAVEAPSTNAAE